VSAVGSLTWAIGSKGATRSLGKRTEQLNIRLTEIMETESPRRKNSWLGPAFAIGFGAGRLPLAPGTWGALEGLLVVFCVHRFMPSAAERVTLWALCLTLGLLAVWAADRLARSLGKEDPQEIVADEIVGQMCCFLWAPITPLTLVVGLILFRVFDISKPFPAGRAEHLPGGVGIIADDLVASVYAGVGLRVLVTFLG
jgi:phosphatidylglycerophosphatase A